MLLISDVPCGLQVLLLISDLPFDLKVLLSLPDVQRGLQDLLLLSHLSCLRPSFSKQRTKSWLSFIVDRPSVGQKVFHSISLVDNNRPNGVYSTFTCLLGAYSTPFYTKYIHFPIQTSIFFYHQIETLIYVNSLFSTKLNRSIQALQRGVFTQCNKIISCCDRIFILFLRFSVKLKLVKMPRSENYVTFVLLYVCRKQN